MLEGGGSGCKGPPEPPDLLRRGAEASSPGSFPPPHLGPLASGGMVLLSPGACFGHQTGCVRRGHRARLRAGPLEDPACRTVCDPWEEQPQPGAEGPLLLPAPTWGRWPREGRAIPLTLASGRQLINRPGHEMDLFLVMQNLQRMAQALLKGAHGAL